MTVICGGGTSSKKAGAQDNLVLAGAGLSLLGLFPGFEWLEAVAVVTETVAYFLPTLCATDPPTMPTFTSGEYLAAATGTRGADYDSFVSKLSDLLQNLAWSQYCKCDSGPQPAAPTAPAQPGGTTILPGVQPCFTFDSGFLSLPTIVTTSAVAVLGTSVDLSDPTTTIPIPQGLTSFDMTLTRAAAGSNHGNIAASGSYFSDNFAGLGTLGGFTTVTVTTSGQQTITVRETPPATARFMKINMNSATHPLDDQGRVQIVAGCYGNPPGATNPPCLPTGDILALLAKIDQYVTFIKNNGTPVGYTLGTAHAGLSGAGAISISGLLGVKVAITTLPSSLGVEGTSPPYHFDAGFITFGTTDGFPQPYRVTRNPQFTLPCSASVYTDLDYDLAPGVVVTITELQPLTT